MDEALISRAITESFTKDFIDAFNVDVAIAGAGPSGLICAYYLAKQNVKVAVFERHLRVGGGMPGGGMMFNRIVVQEEAMPILKEFGVSAKRYKKDLYIVDALEAISTFCSKTIKRGAKIFNLINVEDVVIRKDRIAGVVLNWSAVSWAKLHVDPMAVRSKAVVDATGHDSEIARIVERKTGPVLRTETGGVIGEKSMWAEIGEKMILENTKEIYPGLIVCGMAANAVFGSPRMGAIFGGMLLSGKKAAEVARKVIKSK
ncbi:MAG: ribose 1,5-bisphosphate isomerase [Omnitrophica bacterium RBG_13_46_9]|nr:MAG: ribose 1,5-bisphosphate isomerase [Omnitrophica bacterium RBG_13_46_9]